MNKKREISNSEADALIDQYLIGKGKLPTKDTTLTNTSLKSGDIMDIVSNSSSDNSIDRHISEKRELEELQVIVSKGFRAVIDEVETLGDCPRTQKLLSMYGTSRMSTFDFMEYLGILIKYSVFDKIETHVTYMLDNPNANIEDFKFFANGLFESLPFKNDEEKEYVKKLLKL